MFVALAGLIVPRRAAFEVELPNAMPDLKHLSDEQLDELIRIQQGGEVRKITYTPNAKPF
jgi:hypothetical protein